MGRLGKMAHEMLLLTTYVSEVSQCQQVSFATKVGLICHVSRSLLKHAADNDMCKVCSLSTSWAQVGHNSPRSNGECVCVCVLYQCSSVSFQESFAMKSGLF